MCTVEQLLAKLFLKFGNLLTEGRLGDMNRRSGAGKTTGFDNLNKIAELSILPDFGRRKLVISR